jgi:hypothetical protein
LQRMPSRGQRLQPAGISMLMSPSFSNLLLVS